jgi:hypothetical protein
MTVMEPVAAVDDGTGTALISAISAPVHCPYRRTTDLLQRLAPGKMRVGFFIGAGCSLSVRVPDGTGTKPLIPALAELTKDVKAQIDSDVKLKTVTATLWERVAARGIPVPTVEDILGHIRTLKSLCGTAGVDGFSEQSLRDLDLAICKQIREIVRKPLPANDTPYHVLASWIQAIARAKPV